MPTQASPWGGGASGSPWGGGTAKRTAKPNDQTQPSGTPPAPQAPPTFAQMQANGQARPAPPAPNSAPAPMTGQPAGGLPQATATATGWHLGDAPPANAVALQRQAAGPNVNLTNPMVTPLGLPGQTAAATGGAETGGNVRTPAGPTDTGPGGATLPGGRIEPGLPTTPPPITPPGTTTPPGYSVTPQTPAISDSLTAATQKALANPDPYATDVMQAQRAAGQAQLTQSFGAQQKALDEEMARRGIGASSIASGYYGDLAGQQATAQAGLESNVLSDEANRQQQGLATALGAGNSLYGAQASSGLGYSQLGLQNALGQGQLGLGQQQLSNQNTQFGQNLDQQLKLGTMSDTTANRGLDIQNNSNNNSLNMQVAALLASMGYPTAQSGNIPTTAPGTTQGTGATGGGSTGGTQTGTQSGGTGTSSGGGTDSGGSGTGTFGWTTPKIPTDTGASFPSSGGLSGATLAALGGQTYADPQHAGQGLPSQTQQAVGADGKPLPTGVQTPGTATTGVGLNTNASGQAASGGPIEDQLLSLTPAQSQSVYGFALSRNPSDYKMVSTAGANGQAAGAGNTTPGETVMVDTTTGHMMPLSKLKAQSWWSGAGGGTATQAGTDQNGNPTYR